MDDLERSLDAVRRAEPPAGARERVRRGAMDEIDRGGRAGSRAWIALPVALAVAAVVLVTMLGRGGSEGAVVVVAADGASLDGAGLARGDRFDDGRVAVRGRGHVQVRMHGGRVSAAGGARLRFEPELVHLESGAAEVEGVLDAEGKGCVAHVDGRSRLA